MPELGNKWPIRSLALFGSVARGEARPDSDVDLLVEFERPVCLSAFLELEKALARVVGRRVDLVSRLALKPHMGKRITQEALRL